MALFRMLNGPKSTAGRLRRMITEREGLIVCLLLQPWIRHEHRRGEFLLGLPMAHRAFQDKMHRSHLDRC